MRDNPAVSVRGPWLSQSRRAGLLAAVATYPVTRLAGTLKRPALDGAFISGIAMASAYGVASVTTTLSRRVARSEEHPNRAGLGAAAVAATAATVAGVVAVRTRRRARALAAEGERLPVRTATLGSAAEVVLVGAAAAASVAVVEGVSAKLPRSFRPEHPTVMTLGLTGAAVALAAASRDTRLARYVALDPDGGDPDDVARFLPIESLPLAVGRAVLVAGASIAVLTVENRLVLALARAVERTDDPGPFSRLGGHVMVAIGVGAAGIGGFALYSSRVAVQERILETAYAAVPTRKGVSGGPGSRYDFADLGREGRRFVSQAYTAEELTGVLGVPAQDPVRVFVPLHKLTDDPAADAEALLAEMDACGAFAKRTLVLAAPTGDGYVSYVFTEAVELLTAGDCAVVVMPYAEMPSALALPGRHDAAAAYATYGRVLAARLRQAHPEARLFAFGESLGSIVSLDAYGPRAPEVMTGVGFDGGLFLGVPVVCRTDRALRPRDPSVRESAGLQFAVDRDQAREAHDGFLVVAHATDPTSLGDVTTLVRHPVDYWGRPGGVHLPIVSFLVNLADVKNAMSLRPGDFHPSLGHDYRFETAAAVSSAFGLPLHHEEAIETALRERELVWSIRRLLSRRRGEARVAAAEQLRDWGVEPRTLTQRFANQMGTLRGWLEGIDPELDAALASLGKEPAPEAESLVDLVRRFPRDIRGTLAALARRSEDSLNLIVQELEKRAA